MTDNFYEFDLKNELLKAIDELGYTEPTPIQSQAIPLMLAGIDVIGQAQTGTGKTAAFALPILNRLPKGNKQIQALILAPTRELAMQVSKAIYEYGQYLDTRVLAIYGGQPYGRQINRLKKGVDIVVGTPGRMLDLIRKGAINLNNVNTVILDEADEMLSMGFIEDIESILQETPATRQTALFSATMPDGVRKLAKKYMHEPQTISIKHKQLTVDGIDQRYYLVNKKDKLNALLRLMEMESITSTLIFMRTRISTGELASSLSKRGFASEALNGDLSQNVREQVLNRFREHRTKVLVATDVAARGLDIDDISHVINYDLPEDPEIYVHRIGRTARAGKTGVALTLITPSEQWRLHRIELFTKHDITQSKLPTIEEIQSQRENKLLVKVERELNRNHGQKEEQMVAELMLKGYEIEDIAVAALKVIRSEEKKNSIPQMGKLRKGRNVDRKDKSKRARSRKNNRSEVVDMVSHERGMVRLIMNKGRNQGVRPNEVVNSISFIANIPGNRIGKIFIQKNESLVDIPEKYVDQVLGKTGSYRIRNQVVKVRKAE